MKRLLLYLLVINLCFVQGCIKDDTSGCELGVNIRYVYTKNPSGTNQFGSAVNKIVLYIFDKDNLYVGNVVVQGSPLTNDYIQNVSLPQEGVYSFVAWCAGSGSGDYEIVQKTANGFDKNFIVGTTKLSDMRMRVLEAKNGVLDTEINDLFFGTQHNVEVVQGSQEVLIEIDLIKNTNTINLSMSGFTPSQTTFEASTHYDVTIATLGGVYNFDNTVDKLSSSLYTYKQYHFQVDGQTLTHSLKTLRLLTWREMMLSITETQTGTEVLSPTNVVSMIMQNPAYATQDDLDIEDTFNIFIKKDVDVTITVNGWEIIDTDIEIK